MCFRQAIFADVCAYWCTQYNLQINPRVRSCFSQDCAIFLRLQYRPSREMRLLELMCFTNILVRPHNLFGIDNVKHESTRRGPTQAFMNNEKFLRKKLPNWLSRSMRKNNIRSPSCRVLPSLVGLPPSPVFLPMFLFQILCPHCPFALLVPSWILASYQVLPHGEFPLRMPCLLFHPHPYHLPN